jgi:hypothetical protein
MTGAFTAPGPELTVHMDNLKGEAKFFDATLRFWRRGIAASGLTRVLARYPFMTAQVTFAIHYQALRLFRGGGSRISGRFPSALQRAAQARGHDAAAGHHHCRPRLRAGPTLGRFHQASYLPGKLLFSLAAIFSSLSRATDLQPFHLEDITAHYVTTLSRWRARLLSSRDQIAALGYSQRLFRAWEYYFA